MSGFVGPRIVWLIRGDERWGVAQAVFGLATTVKSKGAIPIMLAIADGPLAQRCRDSGLTTVALNMPSPPIMNGGIVHKLRVFMQLRSYSRSVAPAVTDAIIKQKADWLHFIWPDLIDIAGIAANHAEIPCTWETPTVLGNYLFGINRHIRQMQLQKYGTIPLAISRCTAESLGNSRIKPITIHLGVDPERFNPRTVVMRTREEFGIPANATVLGIVARIRKGKGQLPVIEALATMKDSHPELHLLLAGGGIENPDDELGKQIRAAIEIHSLRNRVHLLGEIPNAESLYGIIDVPMNTLMGTEAFGLSVVEAMMMERPVLVHANGGPNETVIDGQTGWHIPAVTVPALTTGIGRALADRPRWAEMGRAARQRAMEHFSSDKQATLFLQLVNQTRRVPPPD